jgi:hypothetical protein
MKLDRRYLLGLCVVIGGSLAFAFAFVASGSGPWPFRDVTSAEAARAGLSITPLSTPTKAQALRAARNAAKFAGQPAEKVVYARCVDTTKVPRLNQDCWAVSLKPRLTRADGPAGASGSSTADFKAWDIVFVDPANGKIIEGTEGQVGG